MYELAPIFSVRGGGAVAVVGDDGRASPRQATTSPQARPWALAVRSGTVAFRTFVKSAQLGSCTMRIFPIYRLLGRCVYASELLQGASALRIVRQDLGQDVGPRHTGEAAHQPARGELGPPEGRTMPAQRRGDDHKRSSRRRSWGAAQTWVAGGHAPSRALQRVARNLAAGQRLHADNRLLARRRW